MPRARADVYFGFRSELKAATAEALRCLIYCGEPTSSLSRKNRTQYEWLSHTTLAAQVIQDDRIRLETPTRPVTLVVRDGHRVRRRQDQRTHPIHPVLDRSDNEWSLVSNQP